MQQLINIRVRDEKKSSTNSVNYLQFWELRACQLTAGWADSATFSL